MMKKIAVEAFAVVASYLVLTVSVASAATLRTYDLDGTTDIGPPLYFSPWDMVKRQVSVDPGTLMMQMRVANATPSVRVEGVWIYKCRDKGPLECVQSISNVPEHVSGNADQSYAWSEVSGGSPEKANTVYFVKVTKGGAASWMGFWTRVTRSSPSSFSVEENDIAGTIKVYAAHIDMISTVREFIGKYSMIPANPAWVSKVVFEEAAGIWEISISGEESFAQPARPGTRSLAVGEIASLSDDYGLVIPVTGSPANPAALYANPSYTCGMFGCESGLGEDQVSCCLDCGCTSGYYCDSSGGCRQESGIGLALYGPVNPAVSNCYESHVVSIPVQVKSPPSGYSVFQKWCKLGGSFSSCPCTAGPNSVYVCGVTVPPVPGCGSGEFRITGNSVRLGLNYMDGSVQRTKYVEAPFPDVTIGSFECGKNGCEPGLGEDQEGCCLDCGCPSGYCDYAPGAEPGEAGCRADPQAADVYLESISQSHFTDHVPPQNVLMGVVIGNSPETLEVTGVSCSMGCSSDSACASSCSLSWSEQASSDPMKTNLSVPVMFSIAGYDPMRDYVLSPELAISVRYRNGTAVVERTIVKQLKQLSVGAHWCGDGIPQSQETHANCCFDAGCPAGQYCDTQSVEGPTAGDGCMPKNFQVVVDSVGSLELTDSSVSHDVPVLIHISNYPTGISVGTGCLLAGGDVPCSLPCTPVPSSIPTEYNLSCFMKIPAIDHVTSLYFDGGERVVELVQNSINVTVSYNNGGEKDTMTTNEPVGNVRIDVTSRCGDGSEDPASGGFSMCESWLGEDQVSCCRDCGCDSFGDDYVCYRGANANGQCLSSSLIALKVNSFRVTGGSEPYCLIGRYGGDCNFLYTHIANATIINSPDDLDILSSIYSLGDTGNYSDDMNCVDTGTYGTWDCGFMPGKIEIGWNGNTPSLPAGTELGGYLNRTFELKMGVSYILNGALFVDNLSDETILPVRIEKAEYLKNCDRNIEDLRKQIDRLKRNQQGYNTMAILYLIAGVAQIALGWLLIDTAKGPHAGAQIAMGWFMIIMGGLQVALSLLGSDTGDSIDVQIEHLEDMVKRSIEDCSSPSAEGLSEALDKVEAMPPGPLF